MSNSIEPKAATVADINNASVPFPANNAKIIYTAGLDLQTREFDKAVSALENLVTDAGGYIEYQDINNRTDGKYRTAYYTVRIPSSKLDVFLGATENVSTVTAMSRSAQDISSSYYDTQLRLDTAKIKLARLQALMKDASNMEDIIALESSISDVEWEIDNLTGTIRNWDSLVDYSTVNITLSEVYAVVKDNPAPLTFGERISGALHSGLRNAKNFALDAMVLIAHLWFVFPLIQIQITKIEAVNNRSLVKVYTVRGKYMKNHAFFIISIYFFCFRIRLQKAS